MRLSETPGDPAAEANSLHAIIVLDRSGSMESCRDATIDGFNEQLMALAALREQTVSVTLMQFDTPVATPAIDVVFRQKPAADAPSLTHDSFVPRGRTPMLDAMGAAIAEGDADTASDALLVALFSDGHENASTEETWNSLAKKIRERTATGRWTFVYVGANQDVVQVAKGLDIPEGNVRAYAATPRDTREGHRRVLEGMGRFSASKRRATERFFEAPPDEPKTT
jgi:Mg-chelatase subunit ChlD